MYKMTCDSKINLLQNVHNVFAMYDLYAVKTSNTSREFEAYINFRPI